LGGRAVNEEKVNVLLVEDNPGDARLVQELLAEVHDAPFELTVVDRLSAAVEQLQAGTFQVVLLDLTLPDSHGLESLRRLHKEAPGMPIIVLTGLDEEILALTAVGEGAHDYLVKSLLDSKTLLRSLCYTVERVERLAEIERFRSQEQRQQELDRLAVLVRTFGSSGSADRPAVREAQPDAFDELVGLYGDLLDTALENRVHSSSPSVTDELLGLAQRLGSLGAGPRAVVEMHLAALREKCRADTPVRAQAYADEGRMMALELMGHLASFYRG